MITTFVNSVFSGRNSSSYAQEETARQQRAEAAMRERIRAAAQQAGQGSSLNVSSNYLVGKNGAVSLTDSTITRRGAASTAPLANFEQPGETQAASLTPVSTRLRARGQFSDISRPNISLPSSEVAKLFGDTENTSALENFSGNAQETIFVRGADGSYYPIGSESTLANGTANDPARLARDLLSQPRSASADSESVRQATHNVSRLYANNVQSLLFGEGQLHAVA